MSESSQPSPNLTDPITDIELARLETERLEANRRAIEAGAAANQGGVPVILPFQHVTVHEPLPARLIDRPAPADAPPAIEVPPPPPETRSPIGTTDTPPPPPPAEDTPPDYSRERARGLTDEEAKSLREAGIDVDELQLQAADATHIVKGESADYAERRLQETAQGRGFLRRIWDNKWRDARRWYHRHRAERQILATAEDHRTGPNIYAARGGDHQADSNAELSALVERMSWSTLDESVLRREETNTTLKNGGERERQLDAELREFVIEASRAGEDSMSDDDIREAVNGILGRYGADRRSYEKEHRVGYINASNAIEKIKMVRKAAQHGLGVERVVELLEINYGKARLGSRTEHREEGVDRAISWLHKRGIGSVIDETVLGAAVVTAITLGKMGSQSAGHLIGFAAAGLGGMAGIGYLRNRYRMTRERTSALRETSLGEAPIVAGESAPGRRRYNGTQYNLASAQDTIAQIEQVNEMLGTVPEDGSPRDLLGAITTIAAADLRMKIADERRRELFRHQGATGFERSNRDLTIGLAQAKVGLRNAIRNASDAELAALGIQRGADGKVDVDAAWERLTTGIQNGANSLNLRIREDITTKDAIFKRERNRASIKVGLISAAIGTSFSLELQEVLAFGSDVIGGTDNIQGLFEADTGQAHQTAARGLWEWANSLDGGGGHAAVSEVGANHINIGDAATLGVPAGYHVTGLGPNHWQLLDGHNSSVADVSFNKDGSLSAATLAQLQAKGVDASGIHLEPEHVVYPGGGTAEDVANNRSGGNTVDYKNFQDYARHNPDNVVGIHRTHWETNGTPVPDGTELKLQYGGNNGLSADGKNYVLSITKMMEMSPHVTQAVHDGHMHALLTASRNAQGHGFDFKYDHTGHAYIPVDSDAGRSLFQVVGSGGDRHVVLTGYQDHVGEFKGYAHDGGGRYDIWATDLGLNKPNFVGMHSSNMGMYPVTVPAHLTGNLTIGAEHIVQPTGPQDTLFFTPVGPLDATREMEPAGATEGTSPTVPLAPGVAGVGTPPPPPSGQGEPGPGEGGPNDPNNPDRRSGETGPEAAGQGGLPPNALPVSPRLAADPQAKLQAGEELDWLFDSLGENEVGRAYRDQIVQRIAGDPVLNDMGEAKAAVLINVDGNTTAEGLRNTISLLASQDEASRLAAPVVVSFNFITSNDPQVAAEQQRLADSVREIVREFSGESLHLTAIVEPIAFKPEYSDPATARVLEQTALRRVYDTIALATHKAVHDGKRSGASDLSIINLASNTATMNRYWLRNNIRASQPTPDGTEPPDILTGTTRIDPREFEAHPALGVMTDIETLANMLAAAGRGTTSERLSQFQFNATQKSNTALRLSAYAAVSGLDPKEVVDPRYSIVGRLAALRGRGEGAGKKYTGYVPGGQTTRAMSSAANTNGEAPDISTPEGFDTAVGIIEHGITERLVKRYSSGLVDSVLAMALDNRGRPIRDTNGDLTGNRIIDTGERLYQTTRDEAGNLSFAFTQAGRERLRDVLVTRERGARIARQLHEPRVRPAPAGSTERPPAGPSTFIPETQPTAAPVDETPPPEPPAAPPTPTSPAPSEAGAAVALPLPPPDVPPGRDVVEDVVEGGDTPEGGGSPRPPLRTAADVRARADQMLADFYNSVPRPEPPPDSSPSAPTGEGTDDEAKTTEETVLTEPDTTGVTGEPEETESSNDSTRTTSPPQSRAAGA